MKKSKFFWFLILMVAVNTYILLFTYQRLNGGVCDLEAVTIIYGMECFGVNYWHSILGLELSILFVFKEKKNNISLLRKWIIAIVIMSLVSLLLTWALLLIAIAYYPITFALIFIAGLITAYELKFKKKSE